MPSSINHQQLVYSYQQLVYSTNTNTNSLPASPPPTFNPIVSPVANHNQPQRSTFVPDSILYDEPPPPSPNQSCTLTQEQHEYLDKLIVDFVVLGMSHNISLSYTNTIIY